jgi:HPt (histidine-containing phosphotransfer) domain-containing protein
MSKIDLSYIESIAGGDKDFIKELLGMYLKSTPTELDNVELFLKNEDMLKLASTFHKIKAPVQMIGQPEIVELLVLLEKKCRANDKSDLPELIGNLKTQLLSLDELVNAQIKAL